MRIAYLTVSMPFGPGEAFLIAEANEIRNSSHDLVIIPRSPKGVVSNSDAAELEHVTVYCPILSFLIVWTAAGVLIKYPKATFRAIKVILKPSGIKTLAKNIIVLPKALWLARYVKDNNIDHIHCHWSLTTATMAMVASRTSGVPWSMTCHRGDIADNNLLQEKVNRAVFTRFISHDGMEMAKNLGVHLPPENTCIIRMGTMITDEINGLKTRSTKFICPANLLPVKGHKHLIEAIRIVKKEEPSIQLDIAGSGPLEEDLKYQVKELDLDKEIRFLGQVPHEHLLSRYSKGDYMGIVLASVDLGDNIREGVPVCLIEALSMGIPAIATRIGGIPELLNNGAGLLVVDKDPTALAEAILQLIKDADLRQELSQTGYYRVANEFNVVNTTRQLLNRIASDDTFLRP